MSKASDKADSGPEIVKAEVAEIRQITRNEAIPTKRVKWGEFAKQHFQVFAWPGTTKDALESELYWTHVARMMNPGDTISVITDDMTMYFECIVMAAGEKWAHVSVLRAYELDNRGRRRTYNYEAEWAGPVHKYRVKRQEDGEIMETGFSSMIEAEDWIHNKRKSDLK